MILFKKYCPLCNQRMYNFENSKDLEMKCVCPNKHYRANYSFYWLKENESKPTNIFCKTALYTIKSYNLNGFVNNQNYSAGQSYLIINNGTGAHLGSIPFFTFDKIAIQALEDRITKLLLFQ